MILKAYEAFHGLNEKPFKCLWAHTDREAIIQLGSAYDGETALYRTGWFCRLNKTVYSIKPRLATWSNIKLSKSTLRAMTRLEKKWQQEKISDLYDPETDGDIPF